MRLIDADELIYMTIGEDTDNPFEFVPTEFIKNAEEVHLVRCKDCIHRPIGDPDEHDIQPSKENDYKCPCLCEDDNWYSWIPDDEWFCANGETE